MTRVSGFDSVLRKQLGDEVIRITQNVIDETGRKYPQGFEDSFQTLIYMQRAIDEAIFIHFGKTYDIRARVILSEGPNKTTLLTLDTSVILPSDKDS